MVTTNQPPDEADRSSGSGYAYAAENIIASPQYQTAEARGTLWCSVDFFFSQAHMYAPPHSIPASAPTRDNIYEMPLSQLIHIR